MSFYIDTLRAIDPAGYFNHLDGIYHLVEDSRGGGIIPEDLSHVLQEAVGGDQCGPAVVAAMDNFKMIFEGGGSEIPHFRLIDDQKIRFDQIMDQLVALAQGSGFDEFFGRIKDGSVDNRKTFFHSGNGQADSEMSLTDSWRAEKAVRFVVLNKTAIGQIHDGFLADTWVKKSQRYPGLLTQVIWLIPAFGSSCR